MKTKNIIVLFDSIAVPYTETFNTPSAHIDSFVKLLKPSSNILDAGCGPGTDSIYLHSLGHNVIGVDLSEKMLDIAKKQTKDIQFIKQDISKIDFPDDSFDAIIASYSLCYLPKKDIPASLDNFRKMLKPDGLLYLGLQEGNSEEISMPEPFNPEMTLEINIMSVDEITELLKNSGFSIIETYIDPNVEKELSFENLCIIARKD